MNVSSKDLKIRLDLQFFSAESEGKTEKATPKRREDARKKGQVAKSNELNTAFILLAFFALMSFLGNAYLVNFENGLKGSVHQIDVFLENSSVEMFKRLIADNILSIILFNGPLWIGLFVVGLLISFAQVGYHPTLKPLTPNFSKMNPLKGIKKIISKDALVELLKAIGKVTILGLVLLNVIKQDLPQYFLLHELEFSSILALVGQTLLKIGFFVGGAFLFLAVLDYAYQRYKHEDSLKMTKQEIKEEYKQMEGDPQLKGKMKQKMREMSMRRMMQEIPDADVIITNPTHFAVAIKYNREDQKAPIVVAKGKDYLAQKIKEKAKEHQVEIVENKLLARTLYASVEIGQEIPPELYGPVAEILAYVYNLKGE